MKSLSTFTAANRDKDMPACCPMAQSRDTKKNQQQTADYFIAGLRIEQKGLPERMGDEQTAHGKDEHIRHRRRVQQDAAERDAAQHSQEGSQKATARRRRAGRIVLMGLFPGLKDDEEQQSEHASRGRGQKQRGPAPMIDDESGRQRRQHGAEVHAAVKKRESALAADIPRLVQKTQHAGNIGFEQAVARHHRGQPAIEGRIAWKSQQTVPGNEQQGRPGARTIFCPGTCPPAARLQADSDKGRTRTRPNSA